MKYTLQNRLSPGLAHIPHLAHILRDWSTSVCQIWATSKPWQYCVSTKGAKGHPRLFWDICATFAIFQMGSHPFFLGHKKARIATSLPEAANIRMLSVC